MKLSKVKSKHYTKLGLGLALLPEVQLNLPAKRVFRYLIENSAYDQQCEDTRDWYAFELLLRHPKRAKIISQFISYFKNCSTDKYWGDVRHSFHVAFRFHKLGWLSKETFLHRWSVFAADDRGDTAIDLLLKLGAQGVKQYATWYGTDQSGKSQPPRLRFYGNGKRESLLQLIKKHELDRENSNSIKRFVAHVKAASSQEIWPHPKRPTNFNEFLSDISAGKIRGRYYNLFENFNENELQQLADGVTIDSSEEELKGLLKPFEGREYEGDVDILIELLDRDYEVSFVPNTIATILSRMNYPQLREIAFNPRPNSWGTYNYLLVVLTQILSQEDAVRIEELLRFAPDADAPHSLGHQLLPLCKAGHTERLQGAIRCYYYNSACGICRRDLMLQLAAKGILTDLERRQMRLDSYEPIRVSFS